MNGRTRGVALAVACCVLSPSVAAWADGADVTATALFEDGRKLMAQHKYGEACPKLAESQRLAPSGGTLINLAECYEKNGQTASAWGAWKDVAARANAAGKADAERNAVARAAALEPSLAKLTIAVAADSDVPGLEVKRDGVALGHAEFGLPIPVDPGAHRIEAAAPKKKPWSGQVDVAPKQTDAHVTISMANDEQAVAAGASTSSSTQTVPVTLQSGAAPPQPESLPSNGTLQRTLGWVGIGVGAAGIAVGAIFGLTAMAKANTATNDGCAGNHCPDTPTGREGLTATTDGQHAATISDVGFIAGGVVAAAGVVVLLTAPSGKTVHAAPIVGPTYGGLALEGRF